MNQNPPPNTGPDHRAPQNPMLGQQGHYPPPPTPPTPPGGYGSGPGVTVNVQRQTGGYPPPMPPGVPPGHYPPPFPPPTPGYGGNPQDTAVMSTKEWLLTLLVMLIPCVNIIMLFIWAFSGSGNLNRRNYSRAYLIFYAIVMGLVFLFYLVMFLFIGAMFNTMFW